MELIDRVAFMKDLIERTEANKDLFRDYVQYLKVFTVLSGFCRDLKEFPTVEVESRAKGEWIGIEYDGYADGNPVYHRWQCQRCGNVISTEEPPDYCCDCGADMRSEDEE